MKDRVSKKFWVDKETLDLINHPKGVGINIGMAVFENCKVNRGDCEIEIFYNPPERVRERLTESEFDEIYKQSGDDKGLAYHYHQKDKIFGGAE